MNNRGCIPPLLYYIRHPIEGVRAIVNAVFLVIGVIIYFWALNKSDSGEI